MDSGHAPVPVRSFQTSAVVGGSIIVAVGAAMLLDRTGLTGIRGSQLFTPMVLMCLGAALMLDRGRDCGEESCWGRRRHGSIRGLWLVAIGAWMMVSQAHVFGLSYSTSWPLFLVIVGLMMVIRGVR